MDMPLLQHINFADLLIQRQPSEVFYKKEFLKIKIRRKDLCRSLFADKVAGLRSATLLKKESLEQVFSCEFRKIFKNTYFTEHLWTTASDDSKAYYYFSSVKYNSKVQKIKSKTKLNNIPM